MGPQTALSAAASPARLQGAQVGNSWLLCQCEQGLVTEQERK